MDGRRLGSGDAANSQPPSNSHPNQPSYSYANSAIYSARDQRLVNNQNPLASTHPSLPSGLAAPPHPPHSNSYRPSNPNLNQPYNYGAAVPSRYQNPSTSYSHVNQNPYYHQLSYQTRPQSTVPPSPTHPPNLYYPSSLNQPHNYGTPIPSHYATPSSNPVASPNPSIASTASTWSSQSRERSFSSASLTSNSSYQSQFSNPTSYVSQPSNPTLNPALNQPQPPLLSQPHSSNPILSNLTSASRKVVDRINGELGGSGWQTQKINSIHIVEYWSSNFFKAILQAVKASLRLNPVKNGLFPENLCDALNHSLQERGGARFQIKDFNNARAELDQSQTSNPALNRSQASPSNQPQSSNPSVPSLTPKDQWIVDIINRELGGSGWQTQKINNIQVVQFSGKMLFKAILQAVKASLRLNPVKNGLFPENLCDALKKSLEKRNGSEFKIIDFENARSTFPITDPLSGDLSASSQDAINKLDEVLGGDQWQTQEWNSIQIVQNKGSDFINLVRRAVNFAHDAMGGEPLKNGRLPDNLCEALARSLNARRENSLAQMRTIKFRNLDFDNAIETLTGRDVTSFKACHNCRENNLHCDGQPGRGCGSCTRQQLDCWYNLKPSRCPSLPSIKDSSIPKLVENSSAYISRLKEALRPGTEEMEKKKEEIRIESMKEESTLAINPKSTATPYKLRGGVRGRTAGRFSCNGCGFFICPNGNPFESKRHWLHHTLCLCGYTSANQHLGDNIASSHLCEIELKGDDLTRAQTEMEAERAEVWDLLEEYVTERLWCHLSPFHQGILDDSTFYGGSTWTSSPSATATPSIGPDSVATTTPHSLIKPVSNATPARVGSSSKGGAGTASTSNSTATPTSSSNWPPPDSRKNNPIYFARSSLQAPPPSPPMKEIQITNAKLKALKGQYQKMKLFKKEISEQNEKAPVIFLPVKLCRCCQKTSTEEEVESQLEEAKSLLGKRVNSLREEGESGSKRRNKDEETDSVKRNLKKAKGKEQKIGNGKGKGKQREEVEEEDDLQTDSEESESESGSDSDSDSDSELESD